MSNTYTYITVEVAEFIEFFINKQMDKHCFVKVNSVWLLDSH